MWAGWSFCFWMLTETPLGIWSRFITSAIEHGAGPEHAELERPARPTRVAGGTVAAAEPLFERFGTRRWAVLAGAQSPSLAALRRRRLHMPGSTPAICSGRDSGVIVRRFRACRAGALPA